MRRVALVGSSGGSTLRDTMKDVFESMRRQLAEIKDVQITAVIFVEASCPLDHATNTTHAVLWKLDQQGSPTCGASGSLDAVNRAACEEEGV